MDELLKLDNQICFPLYVASKEVIRRYTPYLKELGLTYTQYIVFLSLWEKDGVSIKELGDKLYLDSGTLTPLINKLIRNGYISKLKGEEDAREVLLLLTEKGKELKNKCLDIPAKIASCVKLNPEEAIIFKMLIDKIVRNFKDE